MNTTTISDDNDELTLEQALAYMGMKPSAFLAWRRRWGVKTLSGRRYSREQLIAARKREAAAKGGPREQSP
jgi:hypothetical protein